jgi:hypothetical protein
MLRLKTMIMPINKFGGVGIVSIKNGFAMPVFGAPCGFSHPIEK